PVLDQAIAQLKQALEGAQAVRLDVCKALRARDQKDFDGAFEALLEEHQVRTDELADPRRDSILAQDYAFEPDRQVNVEALALLRLAEWQGLKAPVETRYCPAPARRSVYGKFKPLGYPGLELEGPAS
ncbi:MAG TPA: Imm49 family immunity protein, partial [Myxococcales bacterium]|nr:Imm49 family immunity protein [Myxococcales bacterium]